MPTIGTTYEVRGLVDKATSYSDAAGNSIVSETRNAYNAFGQLTVQHQEHGGAVNTSSSPKTQYAYADGSANTIRPTAMTYPDGVVLEYLYSDAAADALSRPRTLRFDGDDVCNYIYLGLSTFVRTDYPEPEVRLTTFLGTGTDLYAAFDRFGRTIEQRWQTFANPTTKLVQLKYGYDRASNRLWREDVAAAGLGVDLDELYAYDGMNRLEAFDRGDLDEEHDSIGTASAQQAWDLDSVGNWQNFFEIVGGDSLDQQRTFNTVNEITDISKTVGPNWADPVYDAAGNMTRITRRAASPDRWAATWDAWNRLVKLEESDGSGGWLTKQENAYDAQNRRTIKKTYVSGSLDETRHYYWTASWQGIEERVVVSSVQEPERQYVYGLRYIDDVVLRDRDTQVGDSGSSSDALVYDERLYAMQDANWNVVALCDDLGTVQRRYAYQPYGHGSAYNASFGSGGPNVQWTKTFASYEYDRDVDLFQVRWRWYSPLLGNWVSRDPAGHGSNLYAYAELSPLMRIDPQGLLPPLAYTQIVQKTVHSKGRLNAIELYWPQEEIPWGNTHMPFTAEAGKTTITKGGTVYKIVKPTLCHCRVDADKDPKRCYRVECDIYTEFFIFVSLANIERSNLLSPEANASLGGTLGHELHHVANTKKLFEILAGVTEKRFQPLKDLSKEECDQKLADFFNYFANRANELFEQETQHLNFAIPERASEYPQNAPRPTPKPIPFEQWPQWTEKYGMPRP